MINLQEVSDTLRSKNKYWITFIGDSITSCEWVHPNWREIVEYVLKDKLQEMFDNYRIPYWGLRCFNFGFDGATSKDILKKLDDVVLLEPNLAILMIGANDPILNVNKEEHAENINLIRRRMLEENVRFVFSTCNKPWNESSAARYRQYVEVDKKLNLGDGQFINLFEISGTFPSEEIYTFKSEENPDEGIKEGELDYWHPNQLGNAFIAKVILNKVFGINFDPEKYWRNNLKGEKFPEY